MNIHEFQAKELLARYGIPTPRGSVAETAAGARTVAAGLGGSCWIVKAQIHAGARGKGGGIRICRSLEEVEAAAEHMLGIRLVTYQTGPMGKKVRRILVEEGAEIAHEHYLAVALDRSVRRLAVMASPEGGMDIEAVAQNSPENIHICRLDENHHIWPFQARQLLYGCGLAAQIAEGLPVIQNLVRLAVENDAVLVEINPLAVTDEGKLLALDAKMNFDESALKRHPCIAALEDPDEGDPLEFKARKTGVNYVRLDGFIGTMVNGAGLAMATMDSIKQVGAEPANFLDVGGGSDEKIVAAGFEIILSDPRVRGILINIFGGIVRCDIVAQGIIAAVKKMGLSLPLVVRLEGTNVDEGRRMLRESGLSFESVSSMSEAARTVAMLAHGEESA